MEVYYPQLHEATTIAGALAPNRIVYLRQAPRYLALSRSAVRYRPFQTTLLDLTRDTDELFKGFSQNCRRQVRKAERAGGTIEVHRNDATAYRDFLVIHNGFVAIKRHAGRISERRLDEIKPFVDVLVAYFEGEPICGHVMIRDEVLQRIGLVWSASTRLNGKVAPTTVSSLNRWLHWYEVQVYKLEGMCVYDFGGVGCDTPELAGIARFKHSFGGTRVIEHNYIVTRSAGRAAVRLFYALRRIRSVLVVPTRYANNLLCWRNTTTAALQRS
jgi:hypothetical protein